MNSRRSVLILAACSFLTYASVAATATIHVDAAKPGPKVSPLLYGIFFEDINLSADGGLYAELIRNRSFEDSDKVEHWEEIGTAPGSVRLSIDQSGHTSEWNRRSLRVDVREAASGRAGVLNQGYWGISLLKGDRYDLSFQAKAAPGFSGPLTVTLEGVNGQVYSASVVPALHSDWKQHRLSFKASQSDPKARLVISSESTGTFWLDMVSLFPRKTWKGRPNGLRPDLAKMLSDLKPSFMRFPGGCWVEGETMKDAYRWKQTIGNISQRRTQHNIWQYEATHGLGFHEYLQLAEDLRAEPLFVINCGMSHREVVPLDRMDEYIQDALDAIEYANGPTTSKWGALRAGNGHPKPFNLQFLQIGNENGGPAYNERYVLFEKAVKAKYPYVRLVANEWNGRPNHGPLEIVDEHYYASPDFFIANSDKYDSYDRNGYKVYVGEYAVTVNGGAGNMRAAVGEAAFMIGMERNSDVVVMSSYAPLFANVNHKRWNPDLICFDSSRVYGLPGYYVQKLFSENRGEVILPVTIAAKEAKPPVRSGVVGVGTWLTQAEFKDLKITKDGRVLFSSDFSKPLDGWQTHGGSWTVADGVLKQNGRSENVRAFVGDKGWNNYIYSLKARKIAGEEGFLIPFLVKDQSAKSWWNIGGWGNTRHALEIDGLKAEPVNGSIETGRWYDIRVEVAATGVKCFLDDKLIHEATYFQTKPLHAVAGYAENDIVLKVVNSSFDPIETTIQITGAQIDKKAKLIQLAAESPESENSLDHPRKVYPVSRTIPADKTSLNHAFPPNSVSVIRLVKRS